MNRRAILTTAALCAAVFFSAPAGAQPAVPAHAADPLRLFVLAARGDGDQLILFDDERFEALHRFVLRGALADGPQFTPDGRHAFVATRDGWVTKFDLGNRAAVAEVRVGGAARSLALSSDGRLLAVASATPESLVFLDTDLAPVKVLDATDAAKHTRSQVSLVRNAPARRSFVAALPDLKELWEISYDPKAAELAEGLVHDYKLREGAFVPGYLNPRRTPLEAAIEQFLLVPDGRHLLGATRGGSALQVVHLDVRRRIVSLPASMRPEPQAGAFWRREGQLWFGGPDRDGRGLQLIDAKDWKILKHVGTEGTGVHVVSHAASRLALLHAPRSASADLIEVLDLDRLEIVAQLRPSPGSAVVAIEFDRDGRRMLASLGGADGALVAYDASTARELRRLSFRGLVGKYNVFNQIARHLN